MLNLDASQRIVDVKLADFGLSTKVKGQLIAGQDSQGTLMYMAPEMLTLDTQFDNRIEAWALGILLCKMLTNKMPFTNQDASDEAALIHQISHLKLDFMDETFDGISLESFDLIENLLKKDPENRLTINDMLKHSWISNESPSEKMNKLT